jgi:predicted site-specific integrase-resolvase
MVMVRDRSEVRPVTGRIALYARVSSQDQKQDLERQLERLRDYAASRGYTVAKEVTELASGLNDQRPKPMKLLQDTSIGTIVIEHRDRLTRLGYHSIEALLATGGRRLEVLFPTDTENELVDDFVSMITSMAARVSGLRKSKRVASQIKRCIEAAMNVEDK